MIENLTTVAEAMAIEAVGAGVQGMLGFGINLVAAPLLELVDPRFVPAPLILAGLVSGLLVAVRERGATDRRGLGLAMVGRVPGTALGVLVVLLAPGGTLRIIVASVVIVAVISSLVGWRVRMTPSSLVGTGVASGIMGTVAGLGGTPMGIVYQDAGGPTLRATLARYAVLGAGLSLIALWTAGKIGPQQLVMAGILLPGVVVGFLASAPLRPVLDRGRLRPAILGLIGLAALAVLVQSFA